eukprot:757543-Hanusia_phi.AAC.3
MRAPHGLNEQAVCAAVVHLHKMLLVYQTAEEAPDRQRVVKGQLTALWSNAHCVRCHPRSLRSRHALPIRPAPSHLHRRLGHSQAAVPQAPHDVCLEGLNFPREEEDDVRNVPASHPLSLHALE